MRTTLASCGSLLAACSLAMLVSMAGLRSARAQVVINELQAANSNTLLDEDGDSSDWLELFNGGSSAVELDGWFLTDDPGDLTRWRMPAVTLDPGRFLVVFCSGKDRRDPTGELHTGFGLDAGGEYLALVRPDGFTIAQEIAPGFPPLRSDISFGVVQDVSRFELVRAGATARWLVPEPGPIDPVWRDVGFDDGAWAQGATGLGYDVGDAPTPEPEDQVNLAPAGTASQSTVGFGGEPGRAIDGNRSGVFGNGSVTHTASGDPNPWWQVELAEPRPLARIVLWNRTDCCSSRLSNFRVLVRGAAGETVFSRELFADGAQAAPASLEIPLPPGTVGSVVRVELLGPNAQGEQYLSLAEVEVYDAGGIGLGPFIETDLEDAMRGRSATALVRVPFEVEDASAIETLFLDVRYDDGLVAWINGVEVARRNAPAELDGSSSAPAERPREEAFRAEPIDATASLGALRSGANVLAIQILNASPDDEEALVAPELTGATIEGEVYRFLLEPSPGAPNAGVAVVGFVEDTAFSVDRGFYTEPFEVTISTPTVDAEIRYTLDGSAPTADSGLVYDGPIPIDTTTTLRAAAFKPGFGGTNIDTQTYIFPEHVVRQTGAGFPTRWGATAADYGMDPNVVDDPAYRDTIVADLQTIPTVSIVMDVEDLFGSRGIYSNTEGRGAAWERAASVEIIYPEAWPGPRDGRGHQVDCGVRIFGFGWRSHDASMKHSFRLLFKSEYGPSKLRYAFFPDWDVDSYDNIVLRCQGSRSWNDFRESIQGTQYIRDAFARYSAKDMGKLTTPSTYVQLYLNGLYWGLYNPVQRPDAKFLEDRFEPPESEYDALNARVGNVEVIDGDRQDWDELLAIVRGNVASMAAYEEVRRLLDVADLADYMLIHFYTGNRDWVGSNGNNMRVAGAPSIGGFRSFCWDMEYSIWNATDNVLGVRADQDTPSTVYSRLRGNDEFRVLFGDRAHRHLTAGGALSPEATEARFLARSREIDRAIVGESARWGDRRREPPYTRDVEWVRERDRLLTSFFPLRSGILLDQLRAIGMYPSVEAPTLSRPGGWVEAGALVRVGSTDGEALYTLDGSDPRLPGGEAHPDALIGGAGTRVTLLASGAPARARVPVDASEGLAWTAIEFDDLAWRSGTTGVGYELATGYADLIGLDVTAEASDVSGSVYVRVPFTVEDPAALASLELLMKYDDGFVAYIDGERVAAANAPEAPSWSSLATASHADNLAVQFEVFDISEAIGRLRPGVNVLAIHGLNVRETSNDLLILPELRAALVTDDGGAVRIERSTRVLARSLAGDEWSALEEEVYWVDTPLRITEIQYNPAPAPEGSPFERDDFEYIELENTGAEAIDLTGVRLAGGVSFDFTDSAVTELAPGEVVVVVESIEGFASRYDIGAILVAGEYRGRLEDAGERLRLVDRLDAPLLDFVYDDAWHPDTDGLGPSLVVLDSAADRDSWADGESWAASAFALGSPGFVEGGGPQAGLQLPGDANQDGDLNMSDAITLLGHLFLGSPPLLPCDGPDEGGGGGSTALMDLNGDGGLNLSDAVHLLSYLFQGGPPPASGIECVRILGCPSACGP